MNKRELLGRVIETLVQERKTAEKTLGTTRQAAIDAPGAMQSHSDTTKSQMSRIADEVERSITEKDNAIRTLQGMTHSGFSPNTGMVKTGSVVEVRTEQGEQELYFILPVGGGVEIIDNGKTIVVVNAQAPLARELIGKRYGQTAKIRIGHQHRVLTITSVQ